MTTLDAAIQTARVIRFDERISRMAALRIRIAELEAALSEEKKLREIAEASLQRLEARWNRVFEPRIEQLTLATIANVVCDYYQKPLVELCSGRRTMDITTPRHVAMYLAKTLTLRSYPQIGSFFRKDHSSVQHAVRRIGASDNHEIQEAVRILSARLKGEDNG